MWSQFILKKLKYSLENHVLFEYTKFCHSLFFGKRFSIFTSIWSSKRNTKTMIREGPRKPTLTICIQRLPIHESNSYPTPTQTRSYFLFHKYYTHKFQPIITSNIIFTFIHFKCLSYFIFSILYSLCTYSILNISNYV